MTPEMETREKTFEYKLNVSLNQTGSLSRKAIEFKEG